MEQEAKRPEPVGFWSALRGTCCGTDIFFRVRYNSAWRTLWHLVLMTILVTAGIVWGEGRRLGKVEDECFEPDGITLTATLDSKYAPQFQKYMITYM